MGELLASVVTLDLASLADLIIIIEILLVNCAIVFFWLVRK